MATAKFDPDLFHGLQETDSHWHDQPQQGLQLEAFHGRITFRSGEVARCTGVEQIDATAADAPFAGVLLAVLPDGSVSRQSFEGRAEAQGEDGALSGSGTWAFLGGTGRFAGLTGGGVLDWRFRDGHWRAAFSGGPAGSASGG